ncbi:baseplate assembly protein [Pseudomonas sp. C9-3]|uniref:baseplate assembly protein n=1 Tax=Pseudomonas sp. C9-3 TaxID=3078264 RepID=UPI0028E3094E|nr:baseplate J/gp47 family protein [Pseudomonas sp. C9-3]
MNAIDLARLPFPEVLEVLDFESILAERKAALLALWPAEQQQDIADRLTLESEPLTKLLQENAYRELVLRARINDAARAVMLAYATNADLDQIGANYNVPRFLIDAGDSQASPPRAPVYETDAEFRRRIQLSFESYTTAGSTASYVFHGLSAAADVADVSAISPIPGSVTVFVLSRTGNGKAGDQLLSAVAAALNAEHVRPMTDNVTVLSASIVTYSIVAELVMLPGPDSAVVRAAAQAEIEDYVREQHALARDITLSGVYHALHQPGVQRVNLTSPTQNLVIGTGEASYCTGITLTVAGYTDV